MRIVTQRDRIRSAIRWFESDCKSLDPETCSVKEVTDAIGVNGIVKMVCDECGAENLDWLLVVGEEDGYEARRASLCKKCVAAIARLAE